MAPLPVEKLVPPPPRPGADARPSADARANTVQPEMSAEAFFALHPPAVPAQGLAVREVRELAELAALRADWNALVARTDDQVFYRHEFVLTWLAHFAPRARLRVLTARDETGRLCAVLPLMEERALATGVPVRQLVSPTNPHSCRFDLVAEDAERASAAFFAYLAADGGWDVLRIMDVPHGGRAWHLARQARAAHFPVGIWKSLESPYVLLPGSVEALQQGLSRNLRSGLRRRRRRLAERGEVCVERVSGGELLDALLAEGFAVERSGWKGRNGTAIAQDPRTLGFYTALAHAAAQHGYLSLYFLRVDGRAIAFDFGLTYGGRYLTLKPGYDEAFHDVSPGQLLTESTLEDCVRRGLAECDLLGPDLPWKRDWADRVRPHSWLYVFRDSTLGRTLHRAKFEWLPAAKRALHQWASTR